MAFDVDGVQSRALDPAAVAGVVAAIWPGAEVVEVTRLRGGLGAVMHRVRVREPDGGEHGLVLRGGLAEVDPPWVIEREHRTLEVLTELGAPVPRPRWLDASGAVLGRPTLAMDLVAGDALVTRRAGADPEVLGRVLAALHALPVEPFAHLTRPATVAEQVDATLPDGRLTGPAFVDAELLWTTIEGGSRRAPSELVTLVHNDFHPGNVLWDGQVATVVDWSWPYLGDPGRDLGYCRYDLTLADGPDAADRFTGAYLAAGGPGEPSWFWDLVAVACSLPSPAGWLRGFHEQGRAELTPALFETRGRAFLDAAMVRAGDGRE